MSKDELKDALRRAQEQNARLQKRVAEAEKSERLLKSILEYIPEGLTVTEGPEVSIRAISRYGQQLIGRPLESIEGRTGAEILESWKLLHPDGVTQAEYEKLPLVRAVTKGEDVREEEWILLRPDGKKIPILLNAGPMRDEQGTITGGLSSWIGMEKRGQLEERLRESEKRFRLAISAAKMGAYSRNLQTGQDHWSPEFLAIYGLGPDEPLPLVDGIPAAVHPEDRPRVLAEACAFYGRTVEQEFSSEHRIVRPNGEIRWVQILGNMHFDPVDSQQVIYGLGIDITQRKRSEEALRESEARYRALISASSQVLYRMSPDWSEMRQLQGGSFLADTAEPNRNWLQDYIHPDDQKRVLESIDKAVRTGTVFELEHRVRRVDGILGWTHSRAVPVRNAAGEVVEWFGAASDITARKQAEDDLRQAMKKADQASRAKSEFLASMSHEIRTPMNGVIGLTELALMQEPKPKIRDYLHMVKQSAKSLLDIINDILDLSKIEAGRVELEHADFDLRDMLESLFETMRMGAEHKALSFTTVIDPGVPDWIKGDESRLRQIFVNLIGNAVKYTDAGQVSVRVGVEDGRGAQDTGGRDIPMPICLLASVKDTGGGIPKDKLGSIFEPFDTGARSAKHDGTGLGLAITKRLVELMGGRITAQSELGRGSTFTFSAALEPASEAAAGEGSGHATVRPDARTLRVLLAEDNEINRFLAVELLKGLGHEVTTVQDGRQALEVLAKERFDLVLMDVQMPQMHGDEVTRRIRAGEAGDPNVPIVALTAYALKGDRERFLAAGMDDYLAKPIDMEELGRVLARIGANGKSAE
ncbi:PAS domain S-box [Desulfocurvibacter africanus PCS]|uniref:Sensory/regulatory protein RpfC n=1 Tax=Desulfocurvibacter africanus PCS TaxID=1262666 RepID=M5PPA4_DESAF|nr:PAS domain-containing protein [Desulfocurvibacter africanus]EMG35804.1 PAS domain S-box [Desulfocurvibacter africanus PCS]